MSSKNEHWTVAFEEGRADMRETLGGKGANLAEMTRLGIAVPPGFTITTGACRGYYSQGRTVWPELTADIERRVAELEGKLGKRLGDPADPLLVSVRSGAPFSMPGMMDTVLNLGLNPQAVEGMNARSGDERFVWDSYRRFIQMFSKVVLDVDGQLFEDAIAAVKQARGVALDTELTADDWRQVVARFEEIVEQQAGRGFPHDPREQLILSVQAVFDSWSNKRAVDYRRLYRIPDDLGTAVNVQAMVFGNMGDDCATGVAFTRDPATGEKVPYGDYLFNAQGEDVVAGIRNTTPLARMADELPQCWSDLRGIMEKLEQHYRDMCDIEFTIERGKLWMLQTRAGKRTAAAAVRIAVEMEAEGLITRNEALLRVEPEQLDQLLHPQFDPNSRVDALTRGMNASPGAAVGRVVFDSETAESWAERDEAVILVRWETTPDDLHGMIAARGILTSHGGKTSHAAVVARGMGKPCVCGAAALAIDAEARECRVGDTVIREGDAISIDGTTGTVVLGEVALVDPKPSSEFTTVLGWADELRRLRVRTNADTPEDSARAREFGAEGIGLCRTEHMFLGDRLPIVREMILAGNDGARSAALDRLLEVQRADFVGIFEAMDGLPVTIRLLDPPLHEFLPSEKELELELQRLELTGGDAGSIREKRALLEQVQKFTEANPMLGLRGCRLGIMWPEIYQMQVRAIVEAACERKGAGGDPVVEIMVPLVSLERELAVIRAESEQICREVLAARGVELDIKIGTMIELPRAAVRADEIARQADFFSFGTNDLTQTTFGFSRDDIEGKFLPRYLQRKVVERNPFETIDDAVGALVELGCTRGRESNPSLKLGLCGEHGGDPESIRFFHDTPLDYVSCSPYRVPIARLAAGQAAARAALEHA